MYTTTVRILQAAVVGAASLMMVGTAGAQETPGTVGSAQAFEDMRNEQGTIGSLCSITGNMGCSYQQPTSSFAWESAKLGVQLSSPVSLGRDNVPTVFTEVERLGNLWQHGSAAGVFNSLFPRAHSGDDHLWYTIHFGPTSQESADSCRAQLEAVAQEGVRSAVCSPDAVTVEEYQEVLNTRQFYS